MSEENRLEVGDSSPAESARAKYPPRQPRKFPLCLTPRPIRLSASLYDRALDCVAPWQRCDYPGRQRAWIELAGQLPWVLRDVRQGKRGYDIATLERLISALDARLGAIDSALAALRVERDRLRSIPPRHTGAIAVDSVSGFDARYRGKKTRVHKTHI